MTREEQIRQHRLSQPIEELRRATRRGWWTQEDCDSPNIRDDLFPGIIFD